jgi:uncharacterized protein (DUF885 family)
MQRKLTPKSPRNRAKQLNFAAISSTPAALFSVHELPGNLPRPSTPGKGRTMKRTIALLLLGVCMACTSCGPAKSDWRQQFQKTADDYFDQVYFHYGLTAGTTNGPNTGPAGGTQTGYHQYDAQLQDFSRKNIDAEIAALKDFEKRVEAIHPDERAADFVPRSDREILLSNIRSELLTLEVIRPWEKNADVYTTVAANGVYTLMQRNFAPADDRLRSAIARERQMPALFAAARANLNNPPRIFTEIAIDQLPGTIGFFQRDVPQAFADAKDAALKAEFAKTNAAVVAALKSYLGWLKTDLLPRSNGDFRLGADTFSKKLLYDEMVDLPLDKLLEIGWADLRKNQEQFRQIAKELEPNKDPREVLDELGAQHPTPGHLIDAFRATFDGLIAFIRSHHILTLASDVRPIVRETPPFMRATTTASMDTPGPFETNSKEAYFNVTLPDASMTPAEVEGYMRSFNIGTLISTADHEAYPGHYVQFLFLPQAPSRVRKILGANTFIEGWAHYCEQMMLDEGYGQSGTSSKDERKAKFLRLGQLQDALLRNARFIVAIQMHTGKMSVEQAVEFFQKEGYQSKEIGVIETRRGAGDPTYLYYTLGKIEILKLRDDVKKKQGAAFSLEKFHDDLLRQGYPPIKIVREAMLGDGSPAL